MQFFIARLLFQLRFIVASYWCDQKALNVKSQFLRHINETEYWTDDLQLWHQPFKKNYHDLRGVKSKSTCHCPTPQTFELNFVKDVSKWRPWYCLCIRGCNLFQLWNHLSPETLHPFCLPLICDQCSYIFCPLSPFKILYHTHLIYIAGKSWIIVISSLLPLQSDFLWFLIIFRALQKWFLETLNVFYFIPSTWYQTRLNYLFSYHQP